MAFKIPGLKFLSGTDAKSRVFIILGAIAGLVILIFFGVRYLGGGGDATGASRVANAPAGLQSVPGGQMTPEFYRAVVQASQQASQQAQISGGSAVPTLINVPGQQPQQNCVVCPSETTANVADDINDLVKQGKLPQEDANRLLDLAKNNVVPEEYEAALNDLVRQGKLTPEQARSLLEKYKKQHANAAANESAQFMDGMIKSGQLSLDTANHLLALQKSGISPSDYAAELNRLVREGKLTPAAAAQLLAQYTQQRMKEQAKQGLFDLKKMAKAGEVTPDVANSLAAMQNKNVPVDEYAAELNRLVAAGKLTPAAAAKLLEQYKKQKGGLGGVGTLAAIIAEEQRKGASPQRIQALKAVADRLATLQANNASIEDYTAELKKAVQAGLLTPAQAAVLLNQYRALLTTPVAGLEPGVETNIPGGEAFAQLQQRVAETPTTPAAAPEQFVTAVAEDNTEALKARQQRIQDLQNAMSSQAQQLLTAWQPPTMLHKEGGGLGPGKEGGAGGPGGGAAGTTTTTTTTVLKRPLIKAGTIYFAVLETAVNSDYPDTPVMATIVQGPLKGAKVLGKLSLATGQDRVSLNFNLMDKESWPTTKSINAFAIDPDTARTVLASDVDYHYMKRYGALMAASFVEGFATAITEAGTSTTGIFGTSTTHPALSTKNKIAVGLGQIGTNFGSVVKKYVDTPTTVRVNAGVGIGILFMGEVTE